MAPSKVATQKDDLAMVLVLLEKLNQIGVALSTEKNISYLMEKILVAAKELTNAEGGTIYLADKEKRRLSFEIMLNDVLHVHYGGYGSDLPPFPPISIYDQNGQVNNSMVVSYSAGYKKKVNIDDAYTAEGFDFRGTKAFDSRMQYRSKSFLTIPMLDAKGELLGVLQLINPRHHSGVLRTFSEFDEQLVESLTSQASVSFSNRLLLEETQQLFEAMIGMINLALDEKSPYTNKHCQRVPIITMMLADSVVNCKEGPLASFYLDDEQKNELRIAALLHDCGKIVTPVHVIDKSKKLELLGDRFDLILARAETVKKQLEFDYQKKSDLPVLKNPDFQKEITELDQDLEFLNTMNRGGEKMQPEFFERVGEVAKKWSYFSVKGEKVYLLSESDVEYLTIPYGTLNQAERLIINYHVNASIKMLESLPWPARLKNVPEYAGGHHERMDGKGYPRGLKKNQMSVPARIMGIADIFEALTAQDRPYKQPKKLSESLKIMDFLADSGHIDSEIYEIFVKDRIYLEYAKQYLNEEQMDVHHHHYFPKISN